MKKKNMDDIEIFLAKCREGDIFNVERFLSAGISPDVQNAEGETALQISAANCFMDIVALLLRKGASIDLPNNFGWTPLMHAARHGHFEVVSLLIQMKAKVNVSNRLGLRPIDVAAWSGSLACLNIIIEAGAIVDNVSLSESHNDLCDISPLVAASIEGHDSIVKALLEKGSSANQASPITGLTPLMLAACNGHKSIVEILIEYGSDANAMDICCRTALNLAILCCKEDIIIFLEDLTQPAAKKSSGGTVRDINILRVVRSGNTAQVKSLLEQNQSYANYTDPDDGVTPLMVACMLGFNEIAGLLISKGAELNAQDLTNGWTPLMYAVFHRQVETVHLLLDNGADIDIYTANGYTAIDLAIHADSEETGILKILLAHSGSEELLYFGDFLTASTSSAIKQSHLTAEKATSRGDSPARFKDLLGGLSSQIRQLSKSSATSPTPDFEIFEETLYDVFPDDEMEDSENNAEGTAPAGAFLCMSKFYAPHERFAHLLKEQVVEAINLPPLPGHVSCVDLVKSICPKKDKAVKNVSGKPRFNSLRVPNLMKRYLKEMPLDCCSQVSENSELSGSLHVQGITNFSDVTMNELKTSSSLQSEDFVFKKEDLKINESESLTPKNSLSLKEVLKDFAKQEHEDSKHENSIEIEDSAGGLTALLSRASLKKYAEKFRNQEIDLETFKYLTEDDLDEIGINSFNSRYKLMEMIDKLKNT